MQLLLLLTCALLATTRSQPAQVFSSDGNLTLAPAHNRSVVVHGELVVKGSRAMTSADVDAALATLEAQISALEAQTAACSCAAPSATTSAVFNTTWDTTKVTAGSSALDQIRLPLEATGSYNFTVVWGDGTQDRVTAHDDAAVTHTYSQEGVYAVVIEGSIEGWRFNNGGDKAKLLSVTQWGPLRLGNNGGYFYGTSNMEIVATDLLDLTNTMDLSRAFTDSGISPGTRRIYVDFLDLHKKNIILFFGLPLFLLAHEALHNVETLSPSHVTVRDVAFGAKKTGCERGSPCAGSTSIFGCRSSLPRL